MPSQPEGIPITVNSRPYLAPEAEMTGRAIKELAGQPIEYLLVLVQGKADQVAGGDDKPVRDDELVALAPGMRFRVVNPATFGGVHE